MDNIIEFVTDLNEVIRLLFETLVSLFAIYQWYKTKKWRETATYLVKSADKSELHPEVSARIGAYIMEARAIEKNNS